MYGALLRVDRSIRVSDCSIRVSWSGKSFLCQLCPEIASKFRIILLPHHYSLHPYLGTYYIKYTITLLVSCLTKTYSWYRYFVNHFFGFIVCPVTEQQWTCWSSTAEDCVLDLKSHIANDIYLIFLMVWCWMSWGFPIL